jgi:hypothetical protein
MGKIIRFLEIKHCYEKVWNKFTPSLILNSRKKEDNSFSEYLHVKLKLKMCNTIFITSQLSISNDIPYLLKYNSPSLISRTLIFLYEKEAERPIA